MEAAAIMKMVEYVFRHFCFIIGVIVSKDDSTMRYVLKYPSIDSQGQVLNSSKVKLDQEITVPSFLADPSHLVEVFANHTFSIVNDGKDQRCGYTKSDALRIKKYWGYMIKKNRRKI